MITSDRNVYVAGHTTRETKEAAQQEAERQGISLSLYLDQALQQKLEADADLKDIIDDSCAG